MKHREHQKQSKRDRTKGRDKVAQRKSDRKGGRVLERERE